MVRRTFCFPSGLARTLPFSVRRRSESMYGFMLWPRAAGGLLDEFSDHSTNFYCSPCCASHSAAPQPLALGASTATNGVNMGVTKNTKFNEAPDQYRNLIEGIEYARFFFCLLSLSDGLLMDELRQWIYSESSSIIRRIKGARIRRGNPQDAISVRNGLCGSLSSPFSFSSRPFRR